MSRDVTPDRRTRRIPDPPPDSGIRVQRSDDGARITLPRLYSQGDVIIAVLSAAIAVWMGVWLRAVPTDPAASTFAWVIMAVIGLFFAGVAVSQGLPVVARRVIEDRGDRLVLGRAVGVRRIPLRSLPKPAIRSVERVWDHGEAEAGAPGVVRVRTGDADYRLGEYLDVAAVSWLEDAVRTMAGL